MGPTGLLPHPDLVTLVLLSVGREGAGQLSRGHPGGIRGGRHIHVDTLYSKGASSRLVILNVSFSNGSLFLCPICPIYPRVYFSSGSFRDLRTESIYESWRDPYLESIKIMKN